MKNKIIKQLSEKIKFMLVLLLSTILNNSTVKCSIDVETYRALQKTLIYLTNFITYHTTNILENCNSEILKRAQLKMKVFCENQSILCTDLFKRIEILTKDCTLEKSEQINSLMFLYKENFSKKYLSLVQRIGIPELNTESLEEYLIDSGFTFIAERYDFSPKQIPFELDFCNQIGNVHISNLDPICILPTLITTTPAVATLPIMYFSLFEILNLNDYITKFSYPSLKE